MIIAVDFDNTLAFSHFKKILGPNQPIIDFVKSRMGKDELILWTCRKGKDLEDAVNYCAEQGITFDYINENTKEEIEFYGDCRKIYADYYIDDKGILPNMISLIKEGK